jgi:hypothetical protein
MYNDAWRRKISSVPTNPNPGTVPAYLNDVFAGIDGTAEAICSQCIFHTFIIIIFYILSVCLSIKHYYIGKQ